jgi:hypothetical protein
VLGDGRERKVEAVDEILDGSLACGEEVQDAPPIWIDDRIEDLLARL